MKETLEEAAERSCESITHPYCDREKSMFIKGTKWQQEIMCQDIIEFAEWIRNNPYVWNYPDKLNDTRTTEELFEQFKKK